jgi:hypothetical protein
MSAQRRMSGAEFTTQRQTAINNHVLPRRLEFRQRETFAEVFLETRANPR